jgi:uncharacterized protein YdaU (DUF1376 family)
MAEHAFFPLAIDAYLADCSHLTDAEHGRYLRILMELWRAPRQRLPNDDAWLARKFQRSVEAVQAELRPLIVEFCQSDGNWITQKRLTKEFKYVQAKSKKQSARAKSRWREKNEKNNATPDKGDIASDVGKSLEDNSNGSSRGNAARHASGNAPTPTPTPTQEDKKDSASSARAGSGEGGEAQSDRPDLKPPTPPEIDAAFALWGPIAYELKIPDPGFLNTDRRQLLAQRLAECGLDGWRIAMTNLREAKWLRDDDDPSKPKRWVNLHNLLQPEHFTGLLENRYAERHEPKQLAGRASRRSAQGGEPTVSDGIAAAFARRSVPSGG